MGSGFSPLDEALALLPGELSPRLQEALVRLGTWLPFARAATEFTAFTQATISATTACRLTEAAGAAYVAIQTAEAERLEQERPAPPTAPGEPAVLQVSADGAMVPLLKGEWAEVKTVAVGRVVIEAQPDAGPRAHAVDLSYFSRLADAETFTRLAWPELHRRGIETAAVVVAPMDGAEWQQTFLDVHRPDAVRILDFPHAMEYLSQAAHATWGEATPAATHWLDQQAHELKHGSPTAVLKALVHLPVQGAPQPKVATAARATALRYLTKRLDQIQYATFGALGYPLGSGSVESANKLVVEVRLKGSGMHWARAHVTPLVALRTVVCSDRWAEAWPRIEQHRRHQARQQRGQRQQARRLAKRSPAPASPPPAPPCPRGRLAPRPPRMVQGRPTADHPWRRPLLAGGRRYAAAHPRS